MQILTIKTLIEFRNKSIASRKTLVNNIKKAVKQPGDEGGGGDYWISCLSALGNAFKKNDTTIIKNKIRELEQKAEETEIKKTKTMYLRNAEMLYHFEDVDFEKWKPSKELQFQKKTKQNSILTLNELKIQATPHYIFTFKKNDVEEIGAIWFVAKLKGYSKVEVGMFADILFRYLNVNFSANYAVNPKYCTAVDIANHSYVNYLQFQEKIISSVLEETLIEIKALM